MESRSKPGSLTPDPTSAKPVKWVPWALVGLPVGLMIGLVIALWIYFEKKEREAVRTHSHARALQREPNTPDLDRHLHILREADAAAPEVRRETLRSYLESTLGPSNMGYQVTEDRHTAGGGERANLSIELPGTKAPREIVIVLAEYGAPPSAARPEQIASFLALAQAVTGSPRVKTIRFLALDASPGTDDAKQRLARALDTATASGHRIALVLKLGDLLAEAGPSAPLLECTQAALRALQLAADRL